MLFNQMNVMFYSNFLFKKKNFQIVFIDFLIYCKSKNQMEKETDLDEWTLVCDENQDEQEQDEQYDWKDEIIQGEFIVPLLLTGSMKSSLALKERCFTLETSKPTILQSVLFASLENKQYIGNVFTV